MEPALSQERQTAYLKILEYGLVAIRNAACGGRTKLCEIEADHIHNLPSLLNEENVNRHHYYIDKERKGYIERLKENGELQYLEDQMILYRGPWKVLMTIALPEIEAKNSEMEAELKRRKSDGSGAG